MDYQASTNLKGEESSSHAEVCADVFVDRPGKFIIKLPRDKDQHHREEADDDWTCPQEWLDVFPNWIGRQDVVDAFQFVNCPSDLIHLDGRIDQHANVVDAQTKDLNRVFQSERIPDEDNLIQESEDEEGEVGWDGLGVGLRRLSGLDTQLELHKQIPRRDVSRIHRFHQNPSLTLRW